MTTRRGFGLYIHWPFCESKCPYCDFNSHVAAAINHDDWTSANLREIQRAQEELPDRILDTVFFGGGTPSLMKPETVDRILRAVRSAWPVSNDLEITLEANPSSVEATRFSEFSDAGVNRVSIGVQALNDHDLKKLGRLHSTDDALRAIEIANANFARVSFDLIYARQNQTLDDWESELGKALALGPSHLSLYQLTIEPGTAFGDRHLRGRLSGLPEEDLAADLFALTQDMTSQAGLPAYEISNHAAPGMQARHNLIYWRGHDWLGIGPGAHGRYTRNGKRVATEAHLAPQKWLSSVASGSGDALKRTLTPLEATEERLMMGLRLTEGVSLSDYPDYTNKINELCEIKMLECGADQVRTTNAGRPILNAILRELLA